MTKAGPKPRLFVSTSSKGLELAYAIQEHLENDAEIVVWMESFSPGTPIYESLFETLRASDFAIIAFSKDDFGRSSRSREPRVNLFFEIGLFVATLGVNRTFLILPKTAKHFVPTDLRGVTVAMFDQKSSNLPRALRPACRRIRQAIAEVGPFRNGKPGNAEPQRKKNVKKGKRSKASSARKARVFNARRSQIFISYSHKDKRWLEKLRTFLAPSTQDDNIFLWDDTMIKPGEEWNPKIETALASATIAVLLVSRHFLASRFILKHELPPLLEAAKNKGLKIIWVYVSAADYKRTPILKYQAAHDIARPLDSRNSAKQNEELLKVCDRINEAAAAK